MLKEGREIYTGPCSMSRASSMLLSHIGKIKESVLLNKALNICTVTEKKYEITGRSTGVTGEQFTDYLIDTIKSLS